MIECYFAVGVWLCLACIVCDVWVGFGLQIWVVGFGLRVISCFGLWV